MALTLTQQLRVAIGNRQMRIYKVTHDESQATISASALDLNYIEAFTYTPTYIASDMATTSVLGDLFTLSVNAVADTLTWNSAHPSGSKGTLLAIGW